MNIGTTPLTHRNESKSKPTACGANTNEKPTAWGSKRLTARQSSTHAPTHPTSKSNAEPPTTPPRSLRPPIQTVTPESYLQRLNAKIPTRNRHNPPPQDLGRLTGDTAESSLDHYHPSGFGHSKIDQNFLSTVTEAPIGRSRPKAAFASQTIQPNHLQVRSSVKKSPIVFPVSPLMTGDAGHFVAYGLIDTNCQFQLLNPSDSGGKIDENLERIYQELRFFIGNERISITDSSTPHSDARVLYSDNNCRENKQYVSPGFATKRIADIPDKVRVAFAEKLEPVFLRFKTQLVDFLYDDLRICSDTQTKKIFVWGRNSGDAKGAHVESDTSEDFFNHVEKLISDHRQTVHQPCQLIFIGDRPKSTPLTNDTQSVATDLFGFWKKPGFNALAGQTGLPSTVLQLLLFYTLSQLGHSSIHFSQRSGIVDRLSFALPAQNNSVVVMIPKNFDAPRVNKLCNYFSIQPYNTPFTPKGRIIKNLHDRLNDIEMRHRIDVAQQRIRLAKPFNLSEIRKELATIKGSPDFRTSQENYLNNTFNLMIEELNTPETQHGINRQITGESLEAIAAVFKHALNLR